MCLTLRQIPIVILIQEPKQILNFIFSSFEVSIQYFLIFLVCIRIINTLFRDLISGSYCIFSTEKQLISFARAILSDPRILVLDEATASVDTIIEQKIQNAIDTIIEGRTSIVIAHRISTVKNADIILVVKDGKIVERGKHEELMAMKGYYHNLYTRQYEDEATSAFLG